MSRFFDDLAAAHIDFIQKQKVFFVATAPLSGEGHVNLSPKGYDSFRVIDERTVCYLDLTGSGVETIAHLKENGRITVMFCAFEGSPRILRIYGDGEAVRPGDADFEVLRARFDAEEKGVRSVIRIAISKVGTSCGYAVPFMRFEEERPALRRYAEKQSPEDTERYWARNNAKSIDGLPGV